MKYRYWLHKTTEKPTHGFGYDSPADEKAKLWNSYTPETCPHVGFLEGAKCGLCGNEYVATELAVERAFGEAV